MLCAFGVFVTIECRYLLPALIVHVTPEAARNLLSRHTHLRRGVDFHAVTGAKQQRFGTTRASQHAICLCISREALARFHVRGVMTEADAEEIHRGTICAV